MSRSTRLRTTVRNGIKKTGVDDRRSASGEICPKRTHAHLRGRATNAKLERSDAPMPGGCQRGSQRATNNAGVNA